MTTRCHTPAGRPGRTLERLAADEDHRDAGAKPGRTNDYRSGRHRATNFGIVLSSRWRERVGVNRWTTASRCHLDEGLGDTFGFVGGASAWTIATRTITMRRTA